jgi:hypothetical protein
VSANKISSIDFPAFSEYNEDDARVKRSKGFVLAQKDF